MKRYSRISSVNLFFSFIPAALRIVRIDLAVRPCFPITLPRSLWATRNSKTVVCSPSMDRTETCSGLSTRAFAICSMSSFIALQTQLVLCFLEWIFSRHLFPSETLLRPATDSIHTGSSLQKGQRCAHRAEGLDARAKNCRLTLSERDAPCCGR